MRTWIVSKGGKTSLSGITSKLVGFEFLKSRQCSFPVGFSSSMQWCDIFPSSHSSMGSQISGFSSAMRLRSYQNSPTFSFKKPMLPQTSPGDRGLNTRLQVPTLLGSSENTGSPISPSPWQNTSKVIGSFRGLLNEISALVAFLMKARRSMTASGLGLSVLTSTVHQTKWSNWSQKVIEAVQTPPKSGVISKSYITLLLGLTSISFFPTAFYKSVQTVYLRCLSEGFLISN